VAEEGMEGGLALSVAAGWTWRLSRRVGLAADGFFIASGGEDSTSARNVPGVQFGPVFSFQAIGPRLDTAPRARGHDDRTVCATMRPPCASRRVGGRDDRR
jgi:hypothetical protein